MKSLALRYSDKFSPKSGTIKEHEKLLNKYGHVWYGKLGNSISDKIIKQILSEPEPKILLIHSGHVDRYWAFIEDIKKEVPELSKVPDYYHDKIDVIKVWFKIKKIISAPRDVMQNYIVVSSKNILSHASKYSMNPCLFIENIDNEKE